MVNTWASATSAVNYTYSMTVNCNLISVDYSTFCIVILYSLLHKLESLGVCLTSCLWKVFHLVGSEKVTQVPVYRMLGDTSKRVKGHILSHWLEET